MNLALGVEMMLLSMIFTVGRFAVGVPQLSGLLTKLPPMVILVR